MRAATLQALGDDVRLRIVEELTTGERTAGELAGLFDISRPGVSRHLRVLRNAGLVEVRSEAQRRVYRLSPEPLAEIDRWLAHHRALWSQRLDALETEVARARKGRRRT